MTITGASEKGSESGSFPVFPGADRLLKLIGALYQRPRFGDRPRELRETDGQWGDLVPRPERTGRKGLPMVCLVRPHGPDDLLRHIDELLEKARPRGVRYARLTLPGDSPDDNARAESAELAIEDVVTVRAILQEARNKLVKAPKVRDSRLTFPLFTLVVWLMDQRLDPNDQNPERTLLRRIQRLGLNQRFRSAVAGLEQAGPTDRMWWKGPLEIVRWLTLGLFRVAVTGQVPLVSGQYRWFLLQPHLAPEMSGSFVRFAQRLVRGEWAREAPEYVARLLVNAFLEDLRRAYRLRPWQVWRKRRMTYPALLLDGITMTNGGYTLLRLINAVRNQVGLFDPLLVISASHEVPPDAGRAIPNRPRYDAARAIEGYRAWQNVLLADRRARRDTAWYLPIRIPTTAIEAERQETEQKLGSFDGYTVGRRAARPMWWATRRARIGAPLLVAALVAGGFVVTLYRHCGTLDPLLTATDSGCIGVSDGSVNLFHPSGDAAIQNVVNRIHSLNGQAAQAHAANPQRPYITLVDLEALSSQDHAADGLTAERESLEGFAVAEQQQLAGANYQPIVRIMIANAGPGMTKGSIVAREIGALAARDRSVVGVVGLDMSSKPTVDTIRALSAAGVPVVAATLSEDDLASTSEMYYQVAPQNQREMAVTVSFARNWLAGHPGVGPQVRVYYSADTTDTYSRNLRQDAVDAFAGQHFRVTSVAFKPDNAQPGGRPDPEAAVPGDQLVGTPVQAGQNTRGFNGFVFFAGRGVPDFDRFLTGVKRCSSKAVIIGDDDVSRFVADPTLRGEHKGVPYHYVSFAAAPADPHGIAEDFYSQLDGMFRFEHTKVNSESQDGHAALSYDAAEVLIAATQDLREYPTPIPVTPGNVWREIAAIRPAPARQSPKVDNVIVGASGVIDYSGDTDVHVPVHKPVAILGVTNGNVTLAGYCGQDSSGSPASWCPAGG